MLLLKSGYILKKDELSAKEIRNILNELTVCPELFNNNSPHLRASETFKVFKESESRYRLPRFYGINKLGTPKTVNIKKGVSIDVEFLGSLKTELQQELACDTVIDKLHSCGGGILSLPTGYGKTTCSLYILSKLKVKTLFIKNF